MKVSGFSFIHDALEGGYPLAEAVAAVRPYVDEIVIVDMQSTDGTLDLLQRLDVRIIEGQWGNQAGDTLRQAHSQYVKCEGEIIISFEADEVFEDRLIRQVRQAIDEGIQDIAVWRLQIAQNFQRCRWYPEPVHRIFPKWADTRKEGHTTNRHSLASILAPENGFLWDCTNCFRDNWMKRVENQAELWHGEARYIMTPLHCLHNAELNETEARMRLADELWTWTETPFNIPKILKPLVGKTSYEPTI